MFNFTVGDYQVLQYLVIAIIGVLLLIEADFWPFKTTHVIKAIIVTAITLATY